MTVGLGLMLGGCVSERIKNSPHWQDGRFHNVDGDDDWRATSGFLKWKLSGRRQPFPEAVAQPARRVEPNVALFKREDFEGVMWVGHATALIRAGGLNLVTDPLWGIPSGYACRLIPQALPIEGLPRLDVVLISHGHREHLDLPTLRRLGDEPLYCVPLGLAGMVRRQGKKRVIEFDWWESHEIGGGVKVMFVPSHHWSRRGVFDERKTLWGGWIVEWANGKIYYAGDTALAPVIEEIGRRFPGIDYAVLPVGSYAPRWFMEPIHMNPSYAVEAFLALGARRLIPVHWGTLQLGDEPPGEAPVALEREMLERGIAQNALRVMAVGETMAMASCASQGDYEERQRVALRVPATLAEHVWVVAKNPPTAIQRRALAGLDRLLIMVPGTTSGDLGARRRLLDRIRAQGGYEVAVFCDWEGEGLQRLTVSPKATRGAARRLIQLCEAFQDGGSRAKPIDLLAHSAGTVVVNKSATEILSAGSSVRFRHVLLLGTALSADASLSDLKSVSAGVVNVHSAYDKVNRNINDRMGVLFELGGGPFRNVRLDRSVGGRIMRHNVFMAANPENWLQYATYLGEGRWPGPEPPTGGEEYAMDRLHGLALWVQARSGEPQEAARRLAPRLLAHQNPEVRYYGAVITGLVRAVELAPTLKAALRGEAPVYLRKEIYQALGNLEDGRQVDFLRRARDLDRPCGEEIRDVLRALKRKRIRPIR